MNTRDDIPEFTDLISMLILEENNLGLDASSSQGKNKSEQAFYSSSSRGRGCGRGQGGGRGQFVKDNQIRGTQVVGETSLEAGGVREAEVQEQIGNKMLQIIESVGLVVRKVTCHMTIQRERHAKWENRETMHLLVEMQVKEEANACLLCSIQ